MKFDALATEPVYKRAIRPILEALPQENRGWLYQTYRTEWDIDGWETSGIDHYGQWPVIVASYDDLQKIRNRPAIMVAHGAGQWYPYSKDARHPSYAGGFGHENVVLFISPSQRVSDRWREFYPDAQFASVGCPAMDKAILRGVKGEPGTIAVAFNWGAAVAPESTTAAPYFLAAIAEIAKTRKVIGTGHPRGMEELAPIYSQLGINVVYDCVPVMESASVLCVDNSSVGWEMLSLNKPVVWLNSPLYRKDIEQGGRFWEFANSGVQCESSGNLADAIDLAIADPPEQKRLRAAAVKQMYEYVDGSATQRAVDAILKLGD